MLSFWVMHYVYILSCAIASLRSLYRSVHGERPAVLVEEAEEHLVGHMGELPRDARPQRGGDLHSEHRQELEQARFAITELISGDVDTIVFVARQGQDRGRSPPRDLQLGGAEHQMRCLHPGRPNRQVEGPRLRISRSLISRHQSRCDNLRPCVWEVGVIIYEHADWKEVSPVSCRDIFVEPLGS